MAGKKTRRMRRRAVQKQGNFFHNINISPWIPYTLLMRVSTDNATPGWVALQNVDVLNHLHQTLGFSPSGDRYLEVRYLSFASRSDAAGMVLAVKLYQITTSPDDVPNAFVCRESLPKYSTEFAQVNLKWLQRSQQCAISLKEQCVVASIYLAKMHPVVCSVKLLFRHAATPLGPPSNATISAVCEPTPAVDAEASHSGVLTIGAP